MGTLKLLKVVGMLCEVTNTFPLVKEPGRHNVLPGNLGSWKAPGERCATSTEDQSNVTLDPLHRLGAELPRYIHAPRSWWCTYSQQVPLWRQHQFHKVRQAYLDQQVESV
jgi:hypothetical protein